MRIIVAMPPFGQETVVDPKRFWKQLETHPAESCERDEYCIIHKPSKNHMSNWDMVWRFDRGLPLLVERMCEHGVSHPDFDVARYFKKIGRKSLLIHGCDLNDNGKPCCSGRKENNGR